MVASHCLSPEACLAQAGKQLVNARGATSALDREQDNFYWFGRINMASTVMLGEQKIIPPELAGPIARGVAHAIDQATKPGFVRPTDVLVTEKIITDFAGPEATLVHTGRSRQDMHPTLTLGQLRVEMLDFADALMALRQQLLVMAAQHTETFVPSYTNGVQAMPISYGQYLLAWADAFGRDGERLREAWQRVNKSPLGAAVLANSSWPLDRRRRAELLGFDGPAGNSYDATQINPMDVALEVVNIAGSAALRVGSLMQDVHVQYHQTRPWLLQAPGQPNTRSALP
ncbi:MAG: argininosuccinate lyase, partial [Burkholderiales bacterium PBB5]